MTWSIERLDDPTLPGLFGLYRTIMAFPPADLVETYWHWKFGRRSPHAADGYSFFVVRDGADVVGALGTQPVTVDVRGMSVPARWTADFMVHPAFRGQGLGKALFARFRAENPLALSVGAVPGSATERIARTVGFRSSAVRYHFKFYNLKALAMRLNRLARPTLALSEMSRCLISWIGGGRRRPSGGCDTKEIERFTPELDGFWLTRARDFAVSARRTHQTLNWKYFDNPFFRYRAVEARRGGRLAGFLVLKVVRGDRLTYGSIAEIVAEDEITQDTLLWWAMTEFEQAQVDAVKTLVSSGGLGRALRRFGFLSIGRNCSFLISRDPDLPADLDEGSNWFLTKGDSDLDMTPDFTRVVAGG